ncbi:MAG: amidohydrolase family protein [Bacillota bacterium]
MGTGRKFLIKDGILLGVGPGFNVVERGWVLVEDGVISKVGEGEPERCGDAEPVDARGSVVMPGLINAHTHVAMSVLRGHGADLGLQDWLEKAIWPLEAKMSREDVYWGALLSTCEMALGGTTAFADMYFYMEEVAKAATHVGIRAALCQGMVGKKKADWWRTLFATRRLWKGWHGAAAGNITVGVGPHAVYTCPPPWLERAIQIAARLDTFVHIHLSETRREVEDCVRRYRATPVELFLSRGGSQVRTLAAHCVHLTERDISMLANAGQLSVAHCPWSNLYLGSGIAPVVELLEAGARVCLGTDGPASSSLSMFETMKLCALLQKGKRRDAAAITGAQVLEMATWQGAVALGLNCGKLEPGREADVVLVEADGPYIRGTNSAYSALVYGGTDQAVRAVMVRGEWVVWDRRLLGLEKLDLNLDRVKQEVSQRARRLGAPALTDT